jgi:dTDP-4-dehydrorhamnose 3,5-epimerase
MRFLDTELKGAFIIELEPRRDDRGLFVRTFCKREFSEINHSKEFVQCNQSISVQKGTLRGMHFQVPPSAEIKLIRCIRGKVFDVIIDLRKDSPTFLEHIEVILSEENMNMIYVPEGFAHGFQTLEDNSQMMYHHTEYYTPENERGLNFNDPAFHISWPLEPFNVSEKDQKYPFIDNNFKGIAV